MLQEKRFFRLDDNVYACLLPGLLTFFLSCKSSENNVWIKKVYNTLNSKEKCILLCRPTYVTYVIALFACAFDIWPLNNSTLLKLMLTYAYNRDRVSAYLRRKGDLKIGGLYDNFGRRNGDEMRSIFDQQQFKS